jgi:hypothetical protein
VSWFSVSCAQYPLSHVLFVLYPAPNFLCSVSYVLCPVFFVPCHVSCVPRPVSYVLLPCALCTMSFVLCPLPCAPCPLPYDLCPVPFVLPPVSCALECLEKSSVQLYLFTNPIPSPIDMVLNDEEHSNFFSTLHIVSQNWHEMRARMHFVFSVKFLHRKCNRVISVQHLYIYL